jgi:hypothetical protein
MTNPTAAQTSDQHGHDLHLHVDSPIDPHGREFAFPGTELVGTAATEAAHAFGHEGNDYTFKTNDGTVVDRTKSLFDAGLHNGDHVEVVNAGGGV